MKKRKGSLLQRMMAVLLSAVLVAGMVSNAAPASVLAEEGSGADSVSGNDVEPAEEANPEGQEQEMPDTDADEDPSEEPDEEAQDTVSENDADSVSGNDRNLEAQKANMMARTLSQTVAGEITSGMTWKDGSTVSQITIKGGSSEQGAVVITVEGSVTVTGTITVASGYVRFTGGGSLNWQTASINNAIVVQDGANAAFESVVLDGSKVNKFGKSALLFQGTGTLGNGTKVQNFSSDTGSGAYAGYKGVIAVHGKGSLTVTDGVTITGNSSTSGIIAIYQSDTGGGESTASVTMSGGTIAGNTVGNSNLGVIWNWCGKLNISGGTVTAEGNEYAVHTQGNHGAYDATTVISGGTFTGNTLGAVCAGKDSNNNSRITITDGIFSGKTAATVNYGVINIEGGSFKGNVYALQTLNTGAALNVAGGEFYGEKFAYSGNVTTTTGKVIVGTSKESAANWDKSTNLNTYKYVAIGELTEQPGDDGQHSHPVCGENCGHSDATHPDVGWTPLTQNSIITGGGGSETTNGVSYEYYNLPAGNYYLTENITIDKVLQTSGEVNLCFNGHTITSTVTGTNNNISSLIVKYKFNACDCKDGGGFTNRGQYVFLSQLATTNLYGGKFSGKDAVYVYGGTFTLDGATLEATGTAINIQSISKAFIKSGSVTSSGNSSVQIYTTNFTMSGGTVTNTSSNGTALNFSYDKAGTITGGTITASGSSGTGVKILNRASVSLSGNPAISGGGGDFGVAGNSKITANSLTGRYDISCALTTSNITEAAPVAFTVDAPNDYSGYFVASDVLKNSGLALRKTGSSGNEQTVEIYRPHKLTHVAAVPATCTAAGEGEYWKCTNSGCGKMFSDADGKTEITSIPVKGALGHNKDGSVAHKDATCTEAGIQGGTYCTRCNEGKSAAETSIPVKGHNYHWTITNEPTMTAGGTAEGVCAYNSLHKETKTLPNLTDTTVWTAGDKVEPTNETDGSQTYTSEYGTVTVTLPSYAGIVAEAKKVIESALAGITATNATTKEEILNVINTAFGNAGITDVTVGIDNFIKYDASTSAAGHIEGVVFIYYCGQTAGSVNMEKSIAQLTAGKYTVTVNNGTGGGEYEAGVTVTITANAAASGQQFDKWTVNSANVTLNNAASSTTTFTMPAEAVSVTAAYKTNEGEGGSGGDHSGGGGSSGGNENNGGNGSGNNNGGGNNSGNNNGNSQTAYNPDTAPVRVKSENQGNIVKEVTIKAEDTFDASFDAVIAATVSELADIVLTQEEKELADDGANIKIVLDIQDAQNTVSAADKAVVESALSTDVMQGFTVGQYLDVNLFKIINDNRSAIRETNKKIIVTIAVPDRLKNTDANSARVFAVVRVHNGAAEVLTDLDNSDDTITIATDRFSSYAIVYNDTADSGVTPGDNSIPNSQKDNEPKTGDITPLELYATLAMIAGFAYLLLYFADRERGMTEEMKKELVARLVGWAKQGGRIRKYLALAAIFVLLVYYHSIGKKTSAEWKVIYGE